jgi:6-phosphogluconolactonase
VDPATGELTLLSRNSSAGAAPCHVSLDREGKHVLVANYWGGSVAVFAVQPDGRLGAVTSFVRHTGVNPTPRDPGPHPHSVHVDPSNRWALVTDLGLDKLFVYRYYGDKGAISPAHEVALDKGAGPRHLAFDQDGRGFFVLNELNGTVVSFAFDPNDGSVTRQHTMSTLQPGFRGANSSAEVVVSRDGRFLYASNRGPNDIAIFEILRPSRELRLVGHQSTLGQHPRNFAIDSTGKFLVVANRDSNNVVAFRIDSMTGQLTPVGKPISVPSPACIRMRWAAS